MSVVAKKSRPEPREVADGKPTFVGPARPKYLIPGMNVYEAALGRIRWIFEQFEGKVAVSNSGGKDSTVVVELAARVAKEMGCLPLRVMWLDQECEFQATVDYQRYLMYERDDIDLWWYQIPFLLENSTNHADHWLKVWDPEHPEDWVRPKEPGSIHENKWGVTHFYDVMACMNELDWRGAMLDGMRVEESPARRLLMTSSPAFKWVTWSTWGREDQDHLDRSRVGTWRFQPIYDWSYRDVWKAIHDNGWKYNAHYDHLFQRGVPIKGMRVSNYHHESALGSLHHLQEVEPETWEAATRRLQGISTYAHLGKDQYPRSLPYMFSSWEEYMWYLMEKLPSNDDYRQMFVKQWHRLLKGCPDKPHEELANVMVKQLVGNDFYGTHVSNYLVSHRSTGRSRREDKV